MLFSGRNASEIGHVGLCVGHDSTGIYMLHSATHSGVLIENWVGQAYYERRYLGARRLCLKRMNTLKRLNPFRRRVQCRPSSEHCAKP